MSSGLVVGNRLATRELPTETQRSCGQRPADSCGAKAGAVNGVAMRRVEFGDWQTPIELAREALALVSRLGGPAPSVVLEPTCGKGAFLVAAADAYERAKLRGYEIKSAYADVARAKLPPARSKVSVSDFFDVEWERELATLKEPILVTGNPPWVTNASLGMLDSENLPTKSNFKGLTGFEALTGKSNFDVSEWMILRLLAALQGRRATFAVLCKTSVARRVIEFTAARGWNVRPGGLWRIDAKRHFRAAVDAVLFVCETGTASKKAGWPVFDALESTRPLSTMTIVDGTAIPDAEAHAKTAHLAGESEPEWRSGLKHDCSRVMELDMDEGGTWVNGLGEHIQIESDNVFFMLKSSDVANGRAAGHRAVIVPQRKIGEDTVPLRRSVPRTWAYLTKHEDLLAARKSSIYRGQPPFAIFGVGPYSFAPWKVAISGMYKRCEFTLVGPQDGRPVMLDDTCYFLPFEDEGIARTVHEALLSKLARSFFEARVFWDAKRPINKSLLQQLDLHALLTKLGLGSVSHRPRQTRLAV